MIQCVARSKVVRSEETVWSGACTFYVLTVEAVRWVAEEGRHAKRGHASDVLAVGNGVVLGAIARPVGVVVVVVVIYAGRRGLYVDALVVRLFASAVQHTGTRLGASI